MFKVSRTILFKATVLGIVFAQSIWAISPFTYFTGIMTAEAAVSDWQKGVSIYPTHPTDFESESFQQSLRNAKAAGATHAVLIVPMYQANESSSNIYSGGDSPTDASLISAIDFAHSIGMSTVIKPHLAPQSGAWRAHINASDRDAWFRNYGSMLNRLGDIGKQNGVSGMVIGTELISMASYTVNGDNTQRWNSMISNLRQHFSGFLTYSANWGGDYFTEEVPHIGFWPSLDFIGISAYYPLAEGQNDPSIDALKGSWGYWDAEKVRAIHNEHNKPVLFTEIGYRSADNSHNRPFDPPQGGYDANEQANDYQALFSYWNTQSYMQGIYLWNWDSNPDAGGQGNTDYTPQNKPALAVLSGWFGGSNNDDTGNDGENGGTGNPGNTGGPSQVSGSWNISGQGDAISSGQSSTMNVTVGNSGEATNVIVDLEIYDQNNGQVAQKFFERQNVTSAAPGQYSISFTPSSNGPYTLKTGIFNSTWSQLYHWNDSVLKLTTSGSTGGGDDNDNGGSGPSDGPAILDVWWPTDGSNISGVQPFKGLVQGRSLSEYSMYWQVDGGSEVPMNDSDADYPHKEFLVDVGPWNWRGDGPYNLRFIAKDNSGNIIAEKSFSINVSH